VCTTICHSHAAHPQYVCGKGGSAMHLAEQEQQQINELVAQAETKSGAQVLVVIVAKADAYPEIPRKAFSIAAAFAGCLRVFSWWQRHWFARIRRAFTSDSRRRSFWARATYAFRDLRAAVRKAAVPSPCARRGGGSPCSSNAVRRANAWGCCCSSSASSARR
jgi:hypothetical protein